MQLHLINFNFIGLDVIFQFSRKLRAFKKERVKKSTLKSYFS